MREMPNPRAPAWDSIVDAADIVKRSASADPEENASALSWMEANRDLAIRAAIHLAGNVEDGMGAAASSAQKWLAEHFDEAAPLVLEYALRPALPSSDPRFLGSGCRTFSHLTIRFAGHGSLDALNEEERGALRVYERSAFVGFTHSPRRTPKWWPVDLRGADPTTLVKALVPMSKAMVALRASLPESDRLASAHAIVDAFIADKAKPENRWALLAALGLAPDPMARRLSRHAWTWSRSKNRNHRTLVPYVITYLRELATPEALARLVLFAEGLAKDELRAAASDALRWIAIERAASMDDLLARAHADLGLRDDGSLCLDYGPRQFVVRFSSEGAAKITEAGEKPRATLPKPGKKDDADLASAAQQRFAETRDDFRHLLRAQSRRFENALRDGKRFSLPELRQELENPVALAILGTLVFRHDGGFFRVSESRELLDVSDEPANVEGLVSLAHPFELSDAEREVWTRVFADYELVPPWPQLHRSTFEGALVNGRVDTCKGWRLHPGSIMGLLQKGWRGEWRARSTLVGLERHVAGGTARVAFDGFGTHDIAAVGPVEIGALLVDATSFERVVLSELLRDLDLARANET